MLLAAAALALACEDAVAQPTADSSSGYFGPTSFNPSMAIVIIVLVSAFFFLGFFSIYIRQCSGDHIEGSSHASIFHRRVLGSGRSRRHRGIDPAVVDSFPTMVFADVRAHKNGALECAVCLSEFEDDEMLKLLPRCSHVFHPDCIGAWLEAHVTCPVCRANVKDTGAGDTSALPPQPEPSQQTLNASVEAVVNVPQQERVRCEEEEAAELERIGSRRRALRSKSSRQPPQPGLSRSHSTGHSLALRGCGDNTERYTLLLPESLLRELVSAGELRRSTSLHGCRSVQLGRSDKWSSALMRTLSSRAPPWTGKRAAETDGSSKAAKTYKAPFECLGGGPAFGSGGERDDGNV